LAISQLSYFVTYLAKFVDVRYDHLTKALAENAVFDDSNYDVVANSGQKDRTYYLIWVV
jgi:hypothetical protein